MSSLEKDYPIDREFNHIKPSAHEKIAKDYKEITRWRLVNDYQGLQAPTDFLDNDWLHVNRMIRKLRTDMKNNSELLSLILNEHTKITLNDLKTSLYIHDLGEIEAGDVTMDEIAKNPDEAKRKKAIEKDCGLSYISKISKGVSLQKIQELYEEFEHKNPNSAPWVHYAHILDKCDAISVMATQLIPASLPNKTFNADIVYSNNFKKLKPIIQNIAPYLINSRLERTQLHKLISESSLSLFDRYKEQVPSSANKLLRESKEFLADYLRPEIK